MLQHLKNKHGLKRMCGAYWGLSEWKERNGNQRNERGCSYSSVVRGGVGVGVGRWGLGGEMRFLQRAIVWPLFEERNGDWFVYK